MNPTDSSFLLPRGTCASPKRISKILDDTTQSTGVNLLFDPVVHEAKPVTSLIAADRVYTATLDKHYCSDVILSMRDNEARWMVAVCEAVECDPIVLPLASNYLNRYICLTYINASTLHYIAGACITIAAKLAQTKPALISHIWSLCDKVNPALLMDYEVDVGTCLNWEFNVPTLYDYFDRLVVLKFKYSKIRDNFTVAAREIAARADFASKLAVDQFAIAVAYGIMVDTRFDHTSFSYTADMEIFAVQDIDLAYDEAEHLIQRILSDDNSVPIPTNTNDLSLSTNAPYSNNVPNCVQWALPQFLKFNPYFDSCTSIDSGFASSSYDEMLFDHSFIERFSAVSISQHQSQKEEHSSVFYDC